MISSYSTFSQVLGSLPITYHPGQPLTSVDYHPMGGASAILNGVALPNPVCGLGFGVARHTSRA
jgi:hypothetical protein